MLEVFCCETFVDGTGKRQRAANLVNLYTKTSERRANERKKGREGLEDYGRGAIQRTKARKRARALASQLVEVSSSSTDSFASND